MLHFRAVVLFDAMESNPKALWMTVHSGMINRLSIRTVSAKNYLGFPELRASQLEYRVYFHDHTTAILALDSAAENRPNL